MHGVCKRASIPRYGEEKGKDVDARNHMGANWSSYCAWNQQDSGSYDSQETIVITLFCVPHQEHDHVLEQLDELVDDMQTTLDYLMALIMIKTPEVTRQYFQEYYLENQEKSGTR
jgi:hypothetical protein